jgi:hypothetical protein
LEAEKEEVGREGEGGKKRRERRRAEESRRTSTRATALTIP